MFQFQHDLNSNESILNHLFLPYYLPETSNDDYLLKHDHQHEHELLENFSQFLNSSNQQLTLPVFSILKNCTQSWSVIQNKANCTIANLQSTIKQLTSGDFLPLYFYAQNAAILIEIDENNINQPLISSWQVLLPSETVTSSLQPYVSYYPTPKYRLSNSAQLTTSAQCELLVEFMSNTIELPKSTTSSHYDRDMREVPIAHYVCHWWISQFENVKSEDFDAKIIKFKKKYRDQIRCKYAYCLPFRRSGLWMTMKIVFQIILTKHLGQIGNLVYKILITNFLLYIIYTKQKTISIHFLVYCCQKIVRRLNKIENMPSTTENIEVKKWIETMKKQIQENIESIFPKSDWQNNIRMKDKITINPSNQNDLTHMCEHSCKTLKEYLNGFQSSKLSSFSRTNTQISLSIISSFENEGSELPFVNVLINSKKKTIDFALTRVEIWIETYFKQWIDQTVSSSDRLKRFQQLQNFFENYQEYALKHYYSDSKSTDPMGYSRYILTSLKILHLIHMKLCQQKQFAQLKTHAIQIPNLLKLFEYLILPNREDMIQARRLYDYFHEFSKKSNPDLLSSIDSDSAFGVVFANKSEQMNCILTEIQIQIERDKNAKRQEINEAKTKYDELTKQIADLVCECQVEVHPYTKCQRCKLTQEANSIKIDVYECPLPTKYESALAVIFELQMPIEIRCYRDILWQFINRPEPVPTNDLNEWLDIYPHRNTLQSYYIGTHNAKVKLVSSNKSRSRTYYFAPQSISSTPIDDFFLENSLRVQISPTKPMEFQNECKILTPQLTDSNYKVLQFSIESTEFVQNRVISQLSNCSSIIKSSQFIEFGSFRSGHRLQWWNLLNILELDSLSMNEEDVAILLAHSLLQYGPVTLNQTDLIEPWCSESHQQLFDDRFVDEFIIRINRRLNECQYNWQHEFVLVNLIIIVMRILTLCKSTKKTEILTLALKCRQLAEKWIVLINETIHNPLPLEFDQIENLRDKLRTIGLAGLLTFSMFTDDTNSMLLSNEHVICFLKLSTTLQDNLILRKKQMNVSVFIRNLLRFNERNLILLQPILNQFIQKQSYECLTKFVIDYWPVNKTNSASIGKWVKRDRDIYDGRYSTQYGTNKISINCVQGTFLVDKVTIGFLPETITSDKLFIRVFRKQIFEVQPSDKKNTFITKYGFHKNSKVHYEFTYSNHCYPHRLIIYERHIETNERFQLIPSNCFENELPEMLVSNYSHWMNVDTKKIEFRPIYFQDSNFLTDKQYILNMKTGKIKTKTSSTTQLLINQSSKIFQVLFERYFNRLDDASYIFMLLDDIKDNDISKCSHFIHIHLSRLGIAFQYDINKKRIISHEYPDMYVDENQWFGTLTGLKAGLLLSPLTENKQQNEYHIFRKVIIPYGHVEIEKTSNNIHPTVIIKQKTSTYEYFVFILNDRLRILQSTDSPTGWLYLALLHAMTSHSLPDQYTGMTGMEQAFQLLHSAGSWSDQPYDSMSLDILSQIASLSPKVTYYPEYKSCHIRIEWNTDKLAYSVQHFGYYLLAKRLYKTSEQLKFMYSTSQTHTIQNLFESKDYNEKTLMKLYWDYRDWYNPIARLSEQMEEEIRCSHSIQSYQPAWNNYLSKTNYFSPTLDNGLYSSGDVDLKDTYHFSCFPLSKWLNDEYQIKNTWIGLYKFIEEMKQFEANKRALDMERFEVLLDFLHYIVSKHSSSVNPICFQWLKSILKSSTTSRQSVSYPSFKRYTRINETLFTVSEIHFGRHLPYEIYHEALDEVRECDRRGNDYENKKYPSRNIGKRRVNEVLELWRTNREFRSHINRIDTYIRSISLVPLIPKVDVNPQKFSIEHFHEHYEIQLNSSDNHIDEQLLLNAKEKYCSPHSNYFLKPNQSIRILNKPKPFPENIFPSIDSQHNPLRNITEHFKTQLNESWKHFQTIEEYQNKYPPIEQINQYLQTYRQQSAHLWNELQRSIQSNNQLLFATGLVTRILPTTLISRLQQMFYNEKQSKSSSLLLSLTSEQCILLGGIMVNWIVEQQIERALHYHDKKKREDFEKEISNIPHTNWTPADYLPWLIFELEMNITIRSIQVDVARHMIEPNVLTNKNIVMQMNMGEGKTSVILPMLALHLSSSSTSLVRIIVLKALFPMNYQSLRCKLGGLLNRRIFPFQCRREMNFNIDKVNEIFKRLKQACENCDIILTSPEDILSFDLLTIDKCRQDEFIIGRTMLEVQRWYRQYIRDVLDESDEILHVKYQLIYSVGRQQQIDAGAERWKMIQSILDIVKQHAATIAKQYENDVFYKSTSSRSHFPEFRLLSREPFLTLSKLILDEWLKSKSFHRNDLQLIESFVLDTNSSLDAIKDRFSETIIAFFLIIRGLLASEVLFVALKRRYRVNFGVNPNSKFNRLMAVPFRAKDVAAENTEFGHPDVALILTHLSYYYSGLNDKQLMQCLNRMNDEEQDPDRIYEDWIFQEDKTNERILNIQHWKSINLKNSQQTTECLFPVLRHNMSVINYFLNHFVFPSEAKQYPNKLVGSAWDLSSTFGRKQIITGFSGTNDTQLLLPVDIQQCDLPKLRQTDALVLSNLLQQENENYFSLPISPTSDEILKAITNCQLNIQVILDVGALFIDGTNRQIAAKWLNLLDKTKIDYAVYFESNEIFVLDRFNRYHAFLTSPASELLDRCVFYLDEIHTRGTDFKFPNGFRAAVTLGDGLTKDRLVQACMRMRKLGKNHWLSFWSSNEVHHQIGISKQNITLVDILRWVYENSQQATWDGLHHWATQSLSFQWKSIAFEDIQQETFYTNDMMKQLAQNCLENEILDLKSMYGSMKTWLTILNIYLARAQHFELNSSNEVHRAVVKRLKDYAGSKKLLSQLLDEEQQRELEREQEMEEERQQKRPPIVQPCQPILHREIQLLCQMTVPTVKLSDFPSVFCPLKDAFLDTTFYQDNEICHWHKNLWISSEFQRVTKTPGESLDLFLRPPRWVLIYRNKYVILVSPFEANWLLGQLQHFNHNPKSIQFPTTTLRPFLPRLQRDQSIFIDIPHLSMPPDFHYSIPIEYLVQLFVFNGTLYLKTNEEQTAYCQCLGLCPKERTKLEDDAFDMGWIGLDGYVERVEHRRQLQLHHCCFSSNPLKLVKKLLETRNNSHAPMTSHIGSIIYNAVKLSLD